jgi:plastocyanin
MKNMLLKTTGFLVLALLIVACSTPNANPAPAEAKPADQAASGNVDIQMKDFAFNPKELTIKVGTKVTWTNMDSAGHDVKAEDGSWGSDTLKSGQTFSMVFDKAGTFPYVCTFHPGMVGTLIVTP